jgi:hypothetical protein
MDHMDRQKHHTFIYELCARTYNKKYKTRGNTETTNSVIKKEIKICL